MPHSQHIDISTKYRFHWLLRPKYTLFESKYIIHFYFAVSCSIVLGFLFECFNIDMHILYPIRVVMSYEIALNQNITSIRWHSAGISRHYHLWNSIDSGICVPASLVPRPPICLASAATYQIYATHFILMCHTCDVRRNFECWTCSRCDLLFDAWNSSDEMHFENLQRGTPQPSDLDA